MIQKHVSIGWVLIILLLRASLLAAPGFSFMTNSTNSTMIDSKRIPNISNVGQGGIQIDIEFENRSFSPFHIHDSRVELDSVFEDFIKVDLIWELLQAANRNEDTNLIADEMKSSIGKLKIVDSNLDYALHTISETNAEKNSHRNGLEVLRQHGNTQPEDLLKHQSDGDVKVYSSQESNDSSTRPFEVDNGDLKYVETYNDLPTSPVAVVELDSEVTITLEAPLKNESNFDGPTKSIRDEDSLQTFEPILTERPEPKATKFEAVKHEQLEKEIPDNPVGYALYSENPLGHPDIPQSKPRSLYETNLGSVENLNLQEEASVKPDSEDTDFSSRDFFASHIEENFREEGESGDGKRRNKRSFLSYFFDDEEPVKKVPELIRSQGYPTEVHKVVTADGYILELHRIPGPRLRHKFRRGKGRKKFKNLFGKRSVDNPGEIHVQDTTTNLDGDDEGWTTDDEFLTELGQNVHFEGAATPVAHVVGESKHPHDAVQNRSTLNSAAVIIEKLKAVKVMLDGNLSPSPLNFSNDHLDSLLGMFTSGSRPRQNASDGEDSSSLLAYLHGDDTTQQLDENSLASMLGSYTNNDKVLQSTNKPKREARIDHYYARLGPPGPIDVTSSHLLPLVVHKTLYSSSWVGQGPIVVKIQPRRPHDRTWPYRRRPGYLRPAVLIHHGLFASSANFVLSDANGGALAYLLADAGYDVWLANWRGNSYSRGHINLDPDQAEFWDFSLDEIIRFDIPAVIDYVLDTTGQRRLFFVGHSLGCAMFFGATNYRPDLSRKVRLMIAMAPAAFMDNSQGILKSTILSMKSYYQVVDWLGVPDVPIPIPWRTQLATNFCGPATVFRLPCFVLLDSFMGKVRTQPQEYYTRVLLSHFPGTVASTRIMAHFGQFVDSGGMHRFNFGADENYRRYGQSTPPRYDLDTVTCPVAVMWGPGDTVITPEDVNQCVHMLPNVVLNYRVPDDSFNHLDFIFPEQAEDIVYRPIMALLARY